MTSQKRICNDGRLKHVSIDQPLTIAPCDGKETIAGASDVFGYIDSNFKRVGCDLPGPPTGETQTCVYEMAKDGTFVELFGDFGEETNRLVLTQPQIIQFVRRHGRWLKRGGNGTFFLFKVSHEYFVAAVYFFLDGRIGVRARCFALERIFRAGKQHRLVVPRLTSVPCFSAPLSKKSLRDFSFWGV